jgi:ketosteroid isomerase-like protein
MRSSFWLPTVLLTSASLLLVSGSLSRPPRAQAQPAATAIADLEKAWDEAYMRRDIAAIASLLGDDYVLTDVSGRNLTKKEHLMSIVKSPEISRIKSWTSENLDVRVSGDSATVTGESAVRGRPGGRGLVLEGRYRFTDTWALRNGRWVAVSTKATRIEK